MRGRHLPTTGTGSRTPFAAVRAPGSSQKCRLLQKTVFHADSPPQETNRCGRQQSAGVQRLTAPCAAVAGPLLAPLASLAASSLVLADIDAATAGKIATVLGPLLSAATFLMISRIPLSWYPNLNVKKLPWVVPVVLTEPVLKPTRKAVPPIIWVAVLSFLNEILLGPQGILNLLQRKVDL